MNYNKETPQEVFRLEGAAKFVGMSKVKFSSFVEQGIFQRHTLQNDSTRPMYFFLKSELLNAIKEH